MQAIQTCCNQRFAYQRLCTSKNNSFPRCFTSTQHQKCPHIRTGRKPSARVVKRPAAQPYVRRGPPTPAATQNGAPPRRLLLTDFDKTLTDCDAGVCNLPQPRAAI